MFSELMISSVLKFIIPFIIVLLISLKSTISVQNDQKKEIDLNFIIDTHCERNIESDKIRCARESISNWDSVDNRERAGCCITWDINDCIIDAVNDKCDRVTYNRVKEYLDKQNKENGEGICSDYPYGSSKCHFPVWAIVLIVIFGLATILTACFVACMIYSKNQAQKVGYF